MNRNTVGFILIFLISILALRFYLFSHDQHAFTNGEEVSFHARLTDMPNVDGRFQRFSLSPANRPVIFITTTRFPTYQYGDLLAVSGNVSVKDSKGRQISSISYPKIRQVQDSNILYRVTAYIRYRILSLYQANLPPTSASLLTGIVFGIKSQMPKDFEDSLRTAGVMHVIAASGMNVSMVAGAVFATTAAVLNRRRAIILSLLAIIFYAILAGLEASIIRATLMAGIAFVAAYLGRQYYGFLALCLTAYIMLLFDPNYLIDVGFQLSFLATLGILYVAPLGLVPTKEKGDRRSKWYQGALDDVAVTVAAQIATLPIMLSSFGQYGLLSIPVNAIVLWTIPPLMVLGSFAAILGFVLPILSVPFLYLSLPLLMYFEQIVSFAGKLNYNLTVQSFPWPLVVGYYCILVAVILFQRKKKANQTS